VTDDAVPPLTVRVMGVTVAITVPDEATRARLARQWSRALVTGEGAEPDKTVQAHAQSPDKQDAEDYRLTTDVTRAALVSTQGRRINLHAAGLADERGRVLAMVGSSGTGKTTATRHLARRLGYLSDETVSMETDGGVHPHAKPLSVVIDPREPYVKAQLSPDDLGLLPTPDDTSIGRFVVLRRGVPEPRGLVPLDTLDGLLELISQSSSLADLPDGLSALVALVEAHGGVWALEYDEIADHVEDLVGLLAADIPPAPVHAPVTHVGGAPRDEGPEGTLGRAPWVESVEIGDEMVVLTHGRAARLQPLMATVWLELAEPRTLDELVTAAQGRHGDHPNAQGLMEKLVDLMLEDGLIVHRAPA
jgi:hypothetical protein